MTGTKFFQSRINSSSEFLVIFRSLDLSLLLCDKSWPLREIHSRDKSALGHDAGNSIQHLLLGMGKNINSLSNCLTAKEFGGKRHKSHCS